MFKLRAIGLFTSAMCAATAAWAEPLDPVYFERYGGTYSTDCDDAQAERLTVFEDRLVFADGDRELVAEDVLANAFFWGRMPPEGFEIALIGGLKPESSLSFLLNSDEQGLYILLEWHPDGTENTDADTGDEIRYYKCE